MAICHGTERLLNGYLADQGEACIPKACIPKEHDLGAAEEALLRTGFDWLATGQCEEPAGEYLLASSGR